MLNTILWGLVVQRLDGKTRMVTNQLRFPEKFHKKAHRFLLLRLLFTFLRSYQIGYIVCFFLNFSARIAKIEDEYEAMKEEEELARKKMRKNK